MSNALSSLRHLLRRPSYGQWSRLERGLGPSALPEALLPDDQQALADSEELRRYLAAQTSQVV
jgi:hypothetical protein